MLPEETILAAFPSSVVCGKTTLRPMTLLHIMAMEAMGIAYDALKKDTALLAAWLLSKKPCELAEIVSPRSGVDATSGVVGEMTAWMKKAKVGKGAALESVAEAMRIAFLPYVPRANGGKHEIQLSMRGYGWPLELAELMMSRYRMTFDEAVGMPMSRLFALMAIGNAANGCGGGPDYYERQQIINIKRAKVTALKRRLESEAKEVDNGEQ